VNWGFFEPAYVHASNIPTSSFPWTNQKVWSSFQLTAKQKNKKKKMSRQFQWNALEHDTCKKNWFSKFWTHSPLFQAKPTRLLRFPYITLSFSHSLFIFSNANNPRHNQSIEVSFSLFFPSLVSFFIWLLASTDLLRRGTQISFKILIHKLDRKKKKKKHTHNWAEKIQIKRMALKIWENERQS
jgi:hypothetical protein